MYLFIEDFKENQDKSKGLSFLKCWFLWLLSHAQDILDTHPVQINTLLLFSASISWFLYRPEQLLEFMHQLPAFANMTMSVRRDLCSVMMFEVVEQAGTVLLHNKQEVWMDSQSAKLKCVTAAPHRKTQNRKMNTNPTVVRETFQIHFCFSSTSDLSTE